MSVILAVMIIKNVTITKRTLKGQIKTKIIY